MARTVTSADGTGIAFERAGDGPPVILVGGAFNDRTMATGLAAALAPELGGIAYDRRGRGDSGDAATYAVEREVADIAALIEHVGGRASVFGHSSGAILALEAARLGLPIDRLAVYEPPYVVGDRRPRPGADLADRLRALVDADRRDDTVALFLTEAVRLPAPVVDAMRAEEVWKLYLRLAHTLPYDVAVCGPGNVLRPEPLARIAVPTLAISGGRTEPWLTDGTRAVAEAVPGARHVVLEGQDHGVLGDPGSLRPLLLEFFLSG
ncbi:alpha/beta fold hydrolase [Nonomuraea jiangxiensis]|uniref:Pimeloyl-ACP methyl ester carboxylesterase n=1 Tax=Nonomuraea jiangxiensis TaxID=633440 RepID=A0A1G8CAB4_9ACTN|nr:alpha/beta hydrolase [Nonomuraea jiangxiensis]SDH42477.1 Pimeloyl-ACP methyl ester carboxylesterase [Nonomuraea jiangxiensis]